MRMFYKFYPVLRFFLFFLRPESAHHFTFFLLKLLHWFRLFPVTKNPSDIKPFQYKGFIFKNRLGLAAGLDKNGDYLGPLAKLGFGFIEVGTVTPKPQLGNPKPRLFRLKNNLGLINRMGFNNKGIDYLVKKISHFGERDFILGVNIGKNKDTPEQDAIYDYLYCLQKAYAFADYIVINISSPNTPGLRNLQEKGKLSYLLQKIQEKRKELREKYKKITLIFLKIAPDLTSDELNEISSNCLLYGIDGVLLTNTSIQSDILLKKDKYQGEIGGISGAPLFPLSTRILKEFSLACANLKNENEANKLLLIGVGGIQSAENALEKIESGADLVQIYSGLIYEGPGIVQSILKVLK